MRSYNPNHPHILVPFIFSKEKWAGGAVYITNIIHIISVLPEIERPYLLLLDLLGTAARDELDSLFQQPAVLAILTPDQRVTALKPEGVGLLAAEDGRPRSDAGQMLLRAVHASFPLAYPYWKRLQLPRPVYWIPDFQHKRLPEFFDAAEREDRDRIFGEIAQARVPLLLSSKAALSDYETYFPDAVTKPMVWSFCSSVAPADLDAAAPGLPDKPFLYVANQFWAHKDHRTLFEAVRLLAERGVDVRLVCTGDARDYRNSGHIQELNLILSAPALAGRVHYLGLLPRAQQVAVFRRAAAIVQPSRFEGWSTVVEDARALGRPLILSDIDVHREQVGDAGRFFRTGDPEDLARVLAEALPDLKPGPDLAAERVAAERAAERQLQAARDLLDTIRTLASNPAGASPVSAAPAAPAPAPGAGSAVALLPPLARPVYRSAAPRCAATCHTPSAGQAEWYPPVMIGAEHVVSALFGQGYVNAALSLIERLTPDPYTRYLSAFYHDGLCRFGGGWRYADIVTVLLCLTDLLKPARYLEIGVRRGRSLCAVASRAPDCGVWCFDMWVQNYAGIDNPGPDFVRGELARVGHYGASSFVDGNSHETVPRTLAAAPQLTFDLITVDGDHSREGAARDLADVLPRLAVGGAIVFDDIGHPAHLELAEVWRTLVADDPRYSAWSHHDVGYGVGFAIRKY